jgi:hypothetical protein
MKSRIDKMIDRAAERLGINVQTDGDRKLRAWFSCGFRYGWRAAQRSKPATKPRLRYYEIYAPSIKEVIGLCTSEGVENAAREDPGVQFRRISRRVYDEANS